MHRAALRRAVTVVAILAVVSGSAAAQAAETRLADRVVLTPAAPAGPQHTCTATRCLITAPHHAAGRPDPTLPAVLLAAGLLGRLGYKRLNAHDDATAPRPTNTEPKQATSQSTQPTYQPHPPASPKRTTALAPKPRHPKATTLAGQERPLRSERPASIRSVPALSRDAQRMYDLMRRNKPKLL
jgi:hypothetical protein